MLVYQRVDFTGLPMDFRDGSCRIDANDAERTMLTPMKLGHEVVAAEGNWGLLTLIGKQHVGYVGYEYTTVIYSVMNWCPLDSICTYIACMCLFS